jgi:hypothetical protein
MRIKLQIAFAISFICFVAVGLNACKKGDDSVPDLGYGYYPTAVGTYVVYDVDSMYHDLGQSDTFHFQVMEVITESFEDNTGTESQRIERFRRDSATGPWVLKDVWFSTVTGTTAERIEENYRFVKMTFPVRENRDWDGNAFNILEEAEYEYDEVDEELTLGVLTFDSTAIVVELDKENAVDTISQHSIYAKNVGLISRYYRDLYYGDADPTIPIIGSEYYMTILDFGQ